MRYAVSRRCYLKRLPQTGKSPIYVINTDSIANNRIISQIFAFYLADRSIELKLKILVSKSYLCTVCDLGLYVALDHLSVNVGVVC